MRRSGLDQWKKIVREKMPHLSSTQAVVLALWSFGVVMVGSCGLTSVSIFISIILGVLPNTARQRLREWYLDAESKKGAKRKELDVSTCFAPILKWILEWWTSNEKRLMLAMDATTVKDIFTILAISVVYRGCAIPVCWVVLPGNKPGSWRPHWIKLLELIKDGIPSDWFVIVTADRGLYAHWLFNAIKNKGGIHF